MTPDDANGPAVVTGGAGAIGAFLCRALAGDQRELRVIDNLSSGRPEHLGPVEKTPGFRFHVLDLRDAEAIRPVFRGASEVWHLAANPDIRRGTAEPRIDLEHGTMASFNVLDAARRADVRRILFSSSSVVYGYPKIFPTPEEYGPLMPESQYGASKLAVEAMVSAFCHSYGMTGYIYRFANIIGPGMTHGVLVDFFEKLRRDPARLEVLGDGRQAKSYLRVEDCVDAMRTVARQARDPVNIYNLGTRDRMSVREIAEKVVAAHRGRARIEYTGGERGWVGDIPQQLLSTEKLTALGWTPPRNSREAVDLTIGEMAAARGL